MRNSTTSREGWMYRIHGMRRHMSSGLTLAGLMLDIETEWTVERIFAHRLECFSEETRMESIISTKDLKSKLDQKQVTVVETLAPERYREAHIPGALNIPPERIKELAPQVLRNKDAEIITYCTNNH